MRTTEQRRKASTFVWRHKRSQADEDHKAQREYGISFDQCRHCGQAIQKVAV